MNKKVFLSYSHDSAEHKNKIWDLSARLRNDGIESIIDQYEDSPIDGWPLWCEKQIRDADFVLVICTETYLKRLMKEETPGKGLGVTWEADIIRNYIYGSGVKTDKFIPIVFKESALSLIPMILRGPSRYQVSTSEGYDSLYRRITGQKPSVPKLGPLSIPKRTEGFAGFWNVPFPRNVFFSGRKEVLQNLHNAFKKQKAIAVNQTQAICGLGGIGKTQLAVEYAYTFRSEYDAIFWVSADTMDTISSGFLNIAQCLGLPEKDNPDRNVIISGVRQWLARNNKWLLIFDNADTPGIVADFIPTEYTGHLLLTSRAQTFDEIGISEPIELSTMEPGEACEFLKKRTGYKSPDEKELNALQEICKKLDNLPLALEQAGAYILTLKCSFENYLLSLKKLGLQILKKSKPVIGKYPKSVETTWTLNFIEVEKYSPASADILRACSFLYPDKIPLELFQQGASELGPHVSSSLSGIELNPLLLDELFEPLRQYSLIRRNTESKTIDIHRLVQAVVQDRMNEKKKQLWAQRIVKAVSKTFPDVEFKSWPVCERLLLHAKRCAAHIDEWKIEGADVGKLLNQIGEYLYYQGRYAEAEPLYKRSLEIREKAHGKDHPHVALSLNNLANLYNTQGRYVEAELLHQRALAIREKALGKDHPGVASSLNDLAALYDSQGRYVEAEPLYQRALAIREKALGKNHPDVASSLNNLALLYKTQGRYVEAEPLYQRALAIWEKALCKDHPDVASSLNNLALLYKTQGRYGEAEPLYQHSLVILEKALGKDHPNVATSLNNLALLYDSQERYSEAEPLYQRALAIREKALSKDHPDVANSLNNLAGLYETQGRYGEAESLYQRSLAIWEKALGKNHSDVATSLNNLAALYETQGRYGEAESLYQRSLAIWEKALGKDHPNVATCLNNLSELYKKQGRHAEAEELLKTGSKPG